MPPVPEMRQEVRLAQEHYDRQAPTYDADHQTHYHAEVMRFWRVFLRNGLRGQECTTLLDLGCGTGLETIDLARTVGAKTAIGVDCSHEMLNAFGRRQVDDLRLVPLASDMHELPIPTESVDIVVSSRGALIYCDAERVLCEIRRVLRQDGHAFLDVCNRWSIESFVNVWKRERKF